MIGARKQPPRDGPDSLLRRDGHLSQLTGDRWRLGELSSEAASVVKAHVDACESCRMDLDAAARMDASFTWPDQAASTVASTSDRGQTSSVAAVRRSSPARNVAWLWSGGMAAAAVLLLLWWPTRVAPVAEDRAVSSITEGEVFPSLIDPDPADDLRRKGEAFELEVYVHDGQRSRLATAGESVQAGDRLGFRVFPRVSGHLMIVGHDSFGTSYLCYPQDTDGASVPIEALDEPATLDQAVELDATSDSERIVALLCPRSFHYDELAATMSTVETASTAQLLPPLVDGCLQRELLLVKGAAVVAP